MRHRHLLIEPRHALSCPLFCLALLTTAAHADSGIVKKKVAASFDDTRDAITWPSKAAAWSSITSRTSATCWSAPVPTSVPPPGVRQGRNHRVLFGRTVAR
jgi:hypothetical protein